DREHEKSEAVGQVIDGGEVVFSTEPKAISPNAEQKERLVVTFAAKEEARAWLEERYPNWRDDSAYWDEEVDA
ncbi:MAG: hypothetical protein ABIG71_01560, partial [Candidatus Uhrbacteria bacterium]